MAWPNSWMMSKRIQLRKREERSASPRKTRGIVQRKSEAKEDAQMTIVAITFLPLQRSGVDLQTWFVGVRYLYKRFGKWSFIKREWLVGRFQPR